MGDPPRVHVRDVLRRSRRKVLRASTPLGATSERRQAGSEVLAVHHRSGLEDGVELGRVGDKYQQRLRVGTTLVVKAEADGGRGRKGTCKLLMRDSRDRARSTCNW